MVKYLLSFILLVSAYSVKAQNTWVFFADKDTSLLSKPELYLSQEAIEKREAKGIAISYTDLPITPNYINQLKANGYQVIGSSKWLNAVLVEGNGYTVDEFRTVVQQVVRIQRSHTLKTNKLTETIESPKEERIYTRNYFQHKMIGVDYLHEQGYMGQGVTITLMDGGFYNVDSIEAFKTLWDSGRITHYYDFVDDDDSVFREDNHGMSVLSIIGGSIKNEFLGAAPLANFILCRTEEGARETHQEEYNWIKAMEWADSIGTDIIHSSLGYSEFDSGQGDYTWVQDMDGNSTIITIAADIAASKGILVTNSAGNEGAKTWQYITAPCDGDSVLCIGSVDSFEVISPFSSKGPASDWRTKPEVVALGQGTTLIQEDGSIGIGYGTSFSGPLVAGLAACLMSARPEKEAMDIFNAIVQSGDKYPSSYDNLYGYGIPHGKTALCILDGVEDDGFEIEIYPNPTTGSIFINGYTKNAKNFEVQVTNSLGQMLFMSDKSDRGNINMEVFAQDWQPGVYFVHVFNNGEHVVKQVVVV